MLTMMMEAGGLGKWLWTVHKPHPLILHKPHLLLTHHKPHLLLTHHKPHLLFLTLHKPRLLFQTLHVHPLSLMGTLKISLVMTLGTVKD
jgi:hypothetical protein